MADRASTAKSFAESAGQLRQMLEGDDDRRALGMRCEAIRLEGLFLDYVQERPTEMEREDAVQGLIDLNRRVLIYVSKRTRSK
jgi:hypothetical protein